MMWDSLGTLKYPGRQAKLTDFPTGKPFWVSLSFLSLAKLNLGGSPQPSSQKGDAHKKLEPFLTVLACEI